MSIIIGKTFTEKKAEEYLERQKQPAIKKISSKKKLNPSIEKAKSSHKFSTDKELESLYKRGPSKTIEPLYIAIGLFIIIIGLILFLITYMSLFVMLIGIILVAYGIYEPKKEYTPVHSENDHYYKKEYKTENGKSWVKGLRGENIVLQHLNTLPKNFFVFHDVKLPKGRGNIDHIVIGSTGLFVIETKNYSGKYRINGPQWYYYKENKYNKIKNNPGFQLMRNIKDLKRFLEDSGIKKSKIHAHGIIAFVQNNYSIVKEPENYHILAPSQIPKYIQTHRKTDTRDILGRIAEEIEPFCTEFTYVPLTEKQIDHINSNDTDITYNLLKSSSGKERSHAAYLLGESKDPQYLEILCVALNDNDGNVRRLSASALGKIGDKKAEDALIGLLKDPKPQVRQYAAKALGQVGSTQSIKHLKNLTDDEKEYVQESAKLAISKIKKN